jgi:tetratricopeptide (TPR) repeat protein
VGQQQNDLAQLIRLLDGYPLALEVVLPNLQQQTPTEILAALQAGDVALDRGDAQDKTRSILQCIDYSHSNLAPADQHLLACLAPFALVVNTDFLPQYTEQLQQQPALAHLDFSRWEAVIEQATDRGLLRPHHDIPSFLHLQPTLPYFLRSRLAEDPGSLNAEDPGSLNAEAQRRRDAEGRAGPVRSAIEAAFRAHYAGYGAALDNLMDSKEPQQRQMGMLLTKLEYENLLHALQLALAAHSSISGLYDPLFVYLKSTQNPRQGWELGKLVLDEMQGYPQAVMQGEVGMQFVQVLGNTATRSYELKQYTAAVHAYQQALDLLEQMHEIAPQRIASYKASIYHLLGRVAQEQRQWAQAEQYYQQALAIDIEYDDRHSQASTYHQLGSVAQAQRQW